MCLVFVAHGYDPRHPLVVAANRDEFYSRPTQPAGFWPDHPSVLAGRDRLAGGTWLGMSTSGRFAALTNFRNPSRVPADPPSRGALVTGFLLSGQSVEGYTTELMGRASVYNGFGLLALSGGALGYVSNGEPPERRMLARGLYGLSNHRLDTPWPKVSEGKRAIRRCLEEGLELERLFEIMVSRDTAPDESLPDTGVGMDLERGYSAAFVDMEHYGTRSTTVIAVDADGEVDFRERTYDRAAGTHHTRCFRFSVDRTALAS